MNGVLPWLLSLAGVCLAISLLFLSTLKRSERALAQRNASRIREFEKALGYMSSSDQLRSEHERIAALMKKFGIDSVEMALPRSGSVLLRLAGDHLNVLE